MPKKILIAYDGSEASSRAFLVALEMAEKFQAALRVLSVIDLPEHKHTAEQDRLLAEARQQIEQAIAPLREIATQKGAELDLLVEAGKPGEHILEHVRRDGYDHIVLGRRGMSRIERWVVGSVSERVLRDAQCPVTIVK